MNKRIKTSILLAGGMPVFAAIVTYSDPLILLLIVVGGLVWLGIPAIVLAIIFLLFAAARGCSTRPPVIIISTILAFGLLGGVAIPINRAVQDHAVTEAKAFPDQIAPLLERYRKEHGTYPDSLGQLPMKPKTPRLLRTSYGYRSNGQTYSFTFSPPGGMIDVWDYSSETHQWHLST